MSSKEVESMSVGKSTPVAKEVNLDVADSAKMVTDFVSDVGDLSGKTTAFEVENMLPVELTLWSYVGGGHPSSGSFGSGTFPDGAPVTTIEKYIDDGSDKDQKYEGLTAYESNGAGAIALMIYRVGTSDVYLILYAGNPSAGASSGAVRIVYNEYWSGYSSTDQQAAANKSMSALNNIATEASGTAKGMGIEVKYDFTGTKDKVARFEITERTDGTKSFGIKSVQYGHYVCGMEEQLTPYLPPLQPNPDTYLTTYNILDIDQQLGMYSKHYITAWEFDGAGQKEWHHYIKVSGQETDMWLNYRASGGRLKVYDDKSTSNWSIYPVSGGPGGDGLPSGEAYIHSLSHEEYLRTDDSDGVCFADVDSDDKDQKACKFELKVLKYN